MGMAQRVAEARRRGSAVLVADVGRPNRVHFLSELRRLLADEAVDFSCHGMAIQRAEKVATRREVPVDILELPLGGPAHKTVRPERPSVLWRSEGLRGPASLLESTCFATETK